MGAIFTAEAGDGYLIHANALTDIVFDRMFVGKLDSNRQQVWGKGFGNYLIGNDLRKMIILPDSDILLFGSESSYDYIDSQTIFGHIRSCTLRLNGNGDSLNQKAHYYLNTCGDENDIYDVKQTSDGGYIMAGESTDYCYTYEVPVQRGWLLKVDSNGCYSPDDPACWPLAVANTPAEPNTIKVYPNPATATLNVATGSAQQATLTLMELSGRLVATQRISGGKGSVDISALAPGLYVYRIVDGKGVVLGQGKVVKD